MELFFFWRWSHKNYIVEKRKYFKLCNLFYQLLDWDPLMFSSLSPKSLEGKLDRLQTVGIWNFFSFEWRAKFLFSLSFHTENINQLHPDQPLSLIIQFVIWDRRFWSEWSECINWWYLSCMLISCYYLYWALAFKTYPYCQMKCPLFSWNSLEVWKAKF